MATQLSSSPVLKLLSYAAVIGGVVLGVSWLMSSGSEELGSSSKSENATSNQLSRKDARVIENQKSQQADDIKQLFARYELLENEKKNSDDVLRKVAQALEEIKSGQSPDAIAVAVKAEIDRHLSEVDGSTSMVVSKDLDTAISEDTGSSLQSTVQQEERTDPVKSGNVGSAGFSLDGYVVNSERNETLGTDEEAVQWVLPADVVQSESGEGGQGFDGLLDKTKNALDFGNGPNATQAKETASKEKLKPIEYATIDKDAILYNATVLNELIGVVANGDSVQNPFNFKLELSADNLATSGVYLPDVAMMRMSGFVRGEWVAGCVEAKITGATFVFNDGTISQISIGDVGKGVGGEGAYLGYLTTLHGSPCIKGKKYSNLAEFAGISGGLAALAAAGDAAASAQYSVTKEGSNVLQAFDGNLASNAAGQGLSEGVNTVNQVIASRYANVRDLVVAPSGQYVVMLSKQINIDYDPEGRKLLNENFETELDQYHANKTESALHP